MFNNTSGSTPLQVYTLLGGKEGAEIRGARWTLNLRGSILLLFFNNSRYEVEIIIICPDVLSAVLVRIWMATPSRPFHDGVILSGQPMVFISIPGCTGFFQHAVCWWASLKVPLLKMTLFPSTAFFTGGFRCIDYKPHGRWSPAKAHP